MGTRRLRKREQGVGDQHEPKSRWKSRVLDVQSPTRPIRLGVECEKKREAWAGSEGPPLERLCNWHQDTGLSDREL